MRTIFVELTQLDGELMWINLALARSVEQCREYAVISFDGDNVERVKESRDQVMHLACTDSKRRRVIE